MSHIPLDRNGSATTPSGFLAGAVAAGLKPNRKLDLAAITSELPCSGAGVFTTNRVKAAPVLFDEAVLKERPGRLRGVLMNAKYANACTGDAGLRDTEQMATAFEQAAELPARSVLVLSTGVIGVPLPMEKIARGVRALANRLEPNGGIKAAEAIMTTDTKAKHASVTIETKGGPISIGGIAKGSGMIHPDLATMLGVITTDAEIDPAHLEALLKRISHRTFNAITVDGDTSTNDTVLMLANAASGISIARDADGWKYFEEATEAVARELALMIVRDGEGATRFVEISITGASSESMGRALGRAIARSTLVKTALAGGDPNWGRVLAAAGASGFPIRAERLKLSVQKRSPDGGPDGDWVILAEQGATAEADEDIAAKIFAESEIAMNIDLGLGGASSTVWTCDLSEDYVRINADYRT